MPKVKRFKWVVSPNDVWHVKYGRYNSEGRCKCGAFATKGWWIGINRDNAQRVCQRCLK
jgi:hypothetical protein